MDTSLVCCTQQMVLHELVMTLDAELGVDLHVFLNVWFMDDGAHMK